MPFHRNRVVLPELLDDQTPEAAAPSLSDVVRINRLTGGHEVARKTFRRLFRPNDRFSVLDVGAASGDAGQVLHREFPNITTTSLDYRLHHLHPADPPRVVADAFRLPLRTKCFDVVYCGLFLHHFADEQVIELLRSFGDVARRFVIVNDLERHAVAYHFLPWTRWLFRWNPITLHDGPVSVQAAFTAAEMRSLAARAGLGDVAVRVYRPAFRIAMVADVSGAKLGV